MKIGKLVIIVNSCLFLYDCTSPWTSGGVNTEVHDQPHPPRQALSAPLLFVADDVVTLPAQYICKHCEFKRYKCTCPDNYAAARIPLLNFLFFAYSVVEVLTNSCAVFLKDAQGDTALHDAVARNNNDIINMLIECNDTDFKLKNQKGFNVLHDAARHGDIKLVTVKPTTHAPETGARNRRHKFDARFWSVCHTVWRASGVKFLPAPVSGVK